MILHAKTVKKFAKKSLVVFDMPYKTYANKFVAYKNAKRVIKLTKCDAIKLEGGTKIVNIINYLVKQGNSCYGPCWIDCHKLQSTMKVKGKKFYTKKTNFRGCTSRI